MQQAYSISKSERFSAAVGCAECCRLLFSASGEFVYSIGSAGGSSVSFLQFFSILEFRISRVQHPDDPRSGKLPCVLLTLRVSVTLCLCVCF